MAVKGSATVTLSQYRDTESVTRYYKLQPSSMAAPDKPANVEPNETPAGWSKAEPACDITKTLYTCDVTVFSDKTTHVSDVSKSTSYEAAKEAWNKAQTAQNTATEAAKTADNYISTDSTGIMVSENKGTTKETPSNATKNNVLITEKDVQIRNGQKVLTKISKDGTYIIDETGKIVCRYTSKGVKIGRDTGKNIEISEGTVSIRDGAVETMRIESTKTIVDQQKTEVFDFDGRTVDPVISTGQMYTKTFTLGQKPSEVISVVGRLPSWASNGTQIEFGDDVLVDYSVSGKNVTIKIEGGNGYTSSLEWDFCDAITIVYVPLSEAESTIYCNNLSVSGTIYTQKADEEVPPIVNMIYPVGSIYMSVNSANPETLFGGTWQQIKDRFLLSAGDTYAAGSTGGSANAVVVKHLHQPSTGDGFNAYMSGTVERVRLGTSTASSARYAIVGKKNASSADASGLRYAGNTDYAGSDGAGKNMPPYLAVYVWQRIS